MRNEGHCAAAGALAGSPSETGGRPAPGQGPGRGGSAIFEDARTQWRGLLEEDDSILKVASSSRRPVVAAVVLFLLASAFALLPQQGALAQSRSGRRPSGR